MGYYKISNLCGLEGVDVPTYIFNLNEKLRKIGVPYYLVAKVDTRKTKYNAKGMTVYDTSWRARKPAPSAELNSKYPNAVYSNQKAVKNVLAKDFGISLHQLERPSTSESAIERAQIWAENKNDEATTKKVAQIKRGLTAQERKAARAHKAEARKLATATKKKELEIIRSLLYKITYKLKRSII